MGALEDLCAAIAARNEAEVLRLVNLVANVNAFVPFREHQLTPLRLALESRSLLIFKTLLDHPAIDVNCVSSDSGTALTTAASHGLTDHVRLLLQHPHINVDFAAGPGTTALQHAVMRQRPDTVQCLLMDGRVDVNATRQDGATALYLACQVGYLDILRLLLSHPQIDVNKPHKSFSPLFIAAFMGHELIVDHLLADPRLQDLSITRITSKGDAVAAAMSRGFPRISERIETALERRRQGLPPLPPRYGATVVAAPQATAVAAASPPASSSAAASTAPQAAAPPEPIAPPKPIAYRADYHARSEVVAELQSRREHLTSTLGEPIKSFQALRATIETLTAQLEEAKRALAEQEREHADALAEFTKLDDEIEKMERELHTPGYLISSLDDSIRNGYGFKNVTAPMVQIFLSDIGMAHLQHPLTDISGAELMVLSAKDLRNHLGLTYADAARLHLKLFLAQYQYSQPPVFPAPAGTMLAWTAVEVAAWLTEQTGEMWSTLINNGWDGPCLVSSTISDILEISPANRLKDAATLVQLVDYKNKELLVALNDDSLSWVVRWNANNKIMS